MAAVTYNFPQPLGVTPSGQPIVECRYFVADPATQGNGQNAIGLSVVVNLDPLDPFGWDKVIEDAIIADAAAQPQPFTVTAARCLTPVYSDALLKESHTYNVPAEGFSLTIGNNVRELLLDPAGALAAGTIVMPGNPQNGRHVRIASTQAIAALTLSPNSGQSFATGAAITAILANGFAEYAFRGSVNKWIRVG